MRKTILFIAMSLDGYIADKNGCVDWIHGQNGSDEDIDTYSDFIKDIDTVIMGWNTYHQIITELSPENWVYDNLTSYIITHRELPSAENIKFIQSDPCSAVRELKQKHGKSIWICGGSNIIQPLVQNKLIDEYYISVIPVILGSGIRLFDKISNTTNLNLSHTRAYNGIVELIYTVR